MKYTLSVAAFLLAAPRAAGLFNSLLDVGGVVFVVPLVVLTIILAFHHSIGATLAFSILSSIAISLWFACTHVVRRIARGGCGATIAKQIRADLDARETLNDVAGTKDGSYHLAGEPMARVTVPTYTLLADGGFSYVTATRTVLLIMIVTVITGLLGVQ